MNNYLFIYGTLLWPANVLREEVRKYGSFFGNGTVYGTLYNLGHLRDKTDGSGF